jgi:hypothetical protein
VPLNTVRAEECVPVELKSPHRQSAAILSRKIARNARFESLSGAKAGLRAAPRMSRTAY